MKNLSTTFIFILFITEIFAQDLTGAWKWQGIDENGKEIIGISIIADQFFSYAWYNAKDGSFIGTIGGSWKASGDQLNETIEYDTKDTSNVGTSRDVQIKYSDDEVVYVSSGKTWKRIDNGSPGDLAGAWLITGRKREDQIVERDPYRPRKTMKILSGTRFQWIAYNSETRQFMGTGGGTYTTGAGKYVENIEFFSRDDSRVGASLDFNFELKEGKWHHSGKSSKGDPIYEVWSIRQR